MNTAAATTKFKLIPNGPKRGKYFCNVCKQYFGREKPRSKNARGAKGEWLEMEG
jgi:hypothetical protein